MNYYFPRNRLDIKPLDFSKNQVEEYILCTLNFSDEAYFLPLRVFSLLSSSLYSQRFGRSILRPSSGVSCRTRDPTQNLELNPLFLLKV